MTEELSLQLNRNPCALVRGMLKRFLTHLPVDMVVAEVFSVAVAVLDVMVLMVLE